MINDIYTMNYLHGRFSYVGTLRNAKKFNIGDKVFFNHKGNEIFPGEIVGVELLPDENPEYVYKVQIPERIVCKASGFDDNFFSGDKNKRYSLTCESIFGTVEEAKASAEAQLEHRYKLQKEEIERYFNKFIKP